MFCSACNGDVGGPIRAVSDSGEVTYTCGRCETREPEIDKRTGKPRTGLPPMPALLSRAWMCGPCGKEQPLVMTLNKAGQLCQQCPECQTQFGAALSKPQADTSGGTRETIRPSPTVSLDGGDGVNASWLRGDARRAPLLATTNAPPQAQARVAPGMRTASLTPGDIINQVRARVADLDMELARLDGLKIERKQLQSMLRVADKIAAQQTALASVACLISDAPDTRQ